MALKAGYVGIKKKFRFLIDNVLQSMPADLSPSNPIATEKEISDIWKAQKKLGAANLLKYPYKVGTQSNRGITFTDNGNGSLTLNGTPSDPTNNSIYPFHGAWNITDLILPPGKYYISTGTDNSDVLISCSYSNHLLGNTGDDGTLVLNAPDGISYITCEVKKGASELTNVLVEPIIQFDTNKDLTYSTYALTNKQLTDKVSLKVIAKADKNQTWATQLAALNTEYNKLSAADKMRCFVGANAYGADGLFLNNAVNVAAFASISMTAAGETFITSIRLSSAVAVRKTISAAGVVSAADLSSDTNSADLYLYGYDDMVLSVSNREAVNDPEPDDSDVKVVKKTTKKTTKEV